jgi:Kdo2-lipid IVA lauroyltransferase/acyltransferase
VARPRRWLFDYAVYLVVRVLVCVIQAVPWSWAKAFADGLAWLAYRVDRRHRLIALDNLRQAYPAMTPEEADATVRAVYRHCCRVLVEMIVLPRKYRASTIDRYVQYAVTGDYERVIGLFNLNRPTIVLTGHFGNWEVLGYTLGLLGYRGGVIARRLDNPYLDRFLHAFRARTGQRILAKKGDYEEIKDSLVTGRGLGVVADQDAGPRGLFVDFFGRPASTFKAVALLSLEYQAPILVFGAARVGDDLQYHLYVGDIIFPEEHAGQADAVRAITQRYTAGLESIVRQHPEQYFWLHRRWKHQPRARAKKAA